MEKWDLFDVANRRSAYIWMCMYVCIELPHIHAYTLMHDSEISGGLLGYVKRYVVVYNKYSGILSKKRVDMEIRILLLLFVHSLVQMALHHCVCKKV